MAGRVSNRFGMLLAQKATMEKHIIAINEVQRETGIAWSTSMPGQTTRLLVSMHW